MDELPVALRNAIEGGNCVLFVGSGVGHYCKTAGGDDVPDAAGLAAALVGQFGLDVPTDTPLPKVARLVELRQGRKELVTALRERLTDLVPDVHLRWVFSLTWKAIYTTNYDDAIERCYSLNPDPPQTPISICSSSEFRDFDSRFEVPVYHLHGCVRNGGYDGILITDEDYARFREHRRMMFETLKLHYASTPILYIGYSHQDPNWKVVTNEVRAEFAPSTPPGSFRVDPGTDAVDKEILAAEGVSTLDATLAEFEGVVRRDLGEIRVDPSSLSQIESAIPLDLRPQFRQSPPAVARLVRSWTYVNQAPFGDDANVRQFVSGDHPNWALISKGVQFERDVEESLEEELLDFATSDNPGVRRAVVLAPAGYGVSTVLMSLAFRLVKEKAGKVLMHRRGRPVNSGDIEFAATSLSGPIFFFVDNVADHLDGVRPAVRRLQDLGRDAYFIFGERLNEWRQLRGRLAAREYGIEPLSDSEIERILQFLDQHQLLGRLADLDREQQVAVIKEKHQKELLVAMKEATEGRAFNAIIEDEYRGLENELSRLLYAAASCFYRARALVRDQLLADVLEVNLAELYEKTRDATEGVVIFEALDEELGIYTARTRHHKIADIVWERALEPGEKERIVQRAMGALNLNFPVDAKAFELFVRSDVVDSIRTVEGKMHFFETASKKDPRSEYVRQHYARMLRSEGLLEAALAQIEAAIDVAPRTRVLYHTKGLILSDLALTLDSVEISRRRLVQAEDVFLKAISMQPRDSYAYHGLAELYLGWAKRSDSGEERADYLARAEQTIADGMRNARERESLYVVSSEILQFIGDEPKALDSLARAIEAHPESTLARYLLARGLLRQGKSQEAIAIVRPVLEKNPEDHRAAIVYARALEQCREPYGKAIAVLEQASLQGMHDPRFVSTFAGMLFMNGEFTQAQRVIDDALRENFTFDERLRVEYSPRAVDDPSMPVLLEGEVVSVKSGYAFIEAAGYPPFFCHSTKFRQAVMKAGKKVRFRPGFCARGPVALEPMEI